jgi:hypothetical protein
MKETSLPPREASFNRLKNEPISEEQHARAQNIWSCFNMKTVKDYHDLYLACDTVLLADVFERFRNFSMSNYGLDPPAYVSAPALSFDSMLRYTKVKLELLTDGDMLTFFERGIRGGLCSVFKRFGKANFETAPDFDKEKDLNYTKL